MTFGMILYSVNLFFMGGNFAVFAILAFRDRRVSWLSLVAFGSSTVGASAGYRLILGASHP